jgi:hypothetical protein
MLNMGRMQQDFIQVAVHRTNTDVIALGSKSFRDRYRDKIDPFLQKVTQQMDNGHWTSEGFI